MRDERYEVEQVIYRYAHALDTRDWALFDTCFAPDAEIEMSVAGSFRSPAAYRKKAQATLSTLDATHHMFTNPRTEVTGDQAQAHLYYQAQHVRQALAPNHMLTIGGWAVVRLTRTESRWRITRWQGTATWQAGNPEVLHPQPR